MATFEQEVVKPLPLKQPEWGFVPNDEIVAYLNKYPFSTVSTDYNGIRATISRKGSLYRIQMAGRTFTVNKTELRQFTMAR